MSEETKKTQTTNNFLSNFDSFRRISDTGNVIIHPDLPYGFIELTGDFVDEVRDDLAKKILMAETEINPLSASTKLLIMLLQDAY
jgi:hypothetical protein